MQLILGVQREAFSSSPAAGKADKDKDKAEAAAGA
jgi:hypothetical protein